MNDVERLLRDMEAEITRLRAELERLHADFHGMQDGSLLRDERARNERLTAELAEEREMRKISSRNVAEACKKANQYRADLEHVQGSDVAMMELLTAARSELSTIRSILAGTDVGSLPHDMPVSAMAEKRTNEHYKYFWQVKDTCVRAEKAEAAFSTIRSETWREAIEAAARWHDEQAARAKAVYDDLDRYAEYTQWRSAKDTNDRHRYCAASIRALSEPKP